MKMNISGKRAMLNVSTPPEITPPQQYQENGSGIAVMSNICCAMCEKALVLHVPRQAKTYLRACAKCADSHHTAHTQSLIWAFALH